jgi:hypothetical protein
LKTADRTIALLIAYSDTGQKDRVIELLQRAYSDHSNAVMPIKVEPIYDPIRNDPRFEDLLRPSIGTVNSRGVPRPCRSVLWKERASSWEQRQLRRAAAPARDGRAALLSMRQLRNSHINRF